MRRLQSAKGSSEAHDQVRCHFKDKVAPELERKSQQLPFFKKSVMAEFKKGNQAANDIASHVAEVDSASPIATSEFCV